MSERNFRNPSSGFRLQTTQTKRRNRRAARRRKLFSFFVSVFPASLPLFLQLIRNVNRSDGIIFGDYIFANINVEEAGGGVAP